MTIRPLFLTTAVTQPRVLPDARLEYCEWRYSEFLDCYFPDCKNDRQKMMLSAEPESDECEHCSKPIRIVGQEGDQ